ncbi:MAG: hypothetical protein V1816_10525, partial [Pseudomonadota bacterium]
PQGAANVSNLPGSGPENSKKWCALRTLQTPDAYMLQFLYKQIKFLLDGLRRSFAGFITLEMQRPALDHNRRPGDRPCPASFQAWVQRDG